MTQLDFVGVTHGNASYGQLIGGGNVIPVVSGKFGNGYVPAGKYSLDKPQATSEKSMVPPGKKSTHKYRLAAIGKPTKVINGKVHFWDERVGKWREGILIHYDGGTPGTLGCIGYIDPKHEGALKEMLADGGKVNVTYHDSVAAAQAHAKTLSGKDAPASDFANKYGGGGSGATKKKPSGKGKPSKTKKGAQATKGERSVRIGKAGLQAMPRTGKVTGGKVKKGTKKKVFLGKKRLAWARDTDPTTQGPLVVDAQHQVFVG